MNYLIPNIVRTPIALIALCFCFSCFDQANAETTLVLAVHPFLSPQEVENRFTPIAEYLGQQTGLDIKVRVGSSYKEHIKYIGSDRVDIAYIGPATYVIMTEKYGDKPTLAKLEVAGQSYFQGNIVVRNDSDIQTMKDLADKRIAFGDPNSTMSYIVPHHMMHEAGVFKDASQHHDFLHSHTNVALGVLSGDYDAGAVKPAVFKKYESKGLRTIAMTPKISEHLFVTRSNLPDKQVQALRNAMLNMRNTWAGLEALRNIKPNITGLVKVEPGEFENLRKIVLEMEKYH